MKTDPRYEVCPQLKLRADGSDFRAGGLEGNHARERTSISRPYVMPTGNTFSGNSTRRYKRRAGDPGSEDSCVQACFDDRAWQAVTPRRIVATPDRARIVAHSKYRSFVSVELRDEDGNDVATDNCSPRFSIEAAGHVTATGNDDPTYFTAFPPLSRKLSSGRAPKLDRGILNSCGSSTPLMSEHDYRAP